jgi:hypothetical protein
MLLLGYILPEEEFEAEVKRLSELEVSYDVGIEAKSKNELC